MPACPLPPGPDFCIAANPDVTGAGVRAAIYIQNFSSFIPAIYALWDKKVTKTELDILETQSTGIIITAFAVLFSVIIQSSTDAPISNFHAAIILNLSWMSSTNTFIFFLLRIYYKLTPLLDKHSVRRNSSASGASPSNREEGGLHPTEYPGTGLHIRNSIRWWIKLGATSAKNFTVILGSLHLTVMSLVGIWLWLRPAAFGCSPTCAMSAPFVVVGRTIPFTSPGLREWSLMIYALTLVPGLNLLPPFLLFLLPYIAIQKFHRDRNNLHSYVIAVRAGLGVLFVVNLSLVTDIEMSLAIAKKPSLMGMSILEKDEPTWTFGQTLALMVLLAPLRDILETLFHRRADVLSQELLKALDDNENEAANRAISLGANLDFKDKYSGDTPAVRAIRKGNATILWTLARSGAKLKGIEDLVDESWFWRAVEGGHIDVLKYLVSYYRFYEILHPMLGQIPALVEQKPPLHRAAENGHTDVVKYLVESHHVDHNVADSDGLTSIHLAARNGHLDVVKYLEGLAPNNADAPGPGGWTPLYLAVRHGHLETVKFLAERQGVDPRVIYENVETEHQDSGNQSLLHLAAERDHLEIVRYFVQMDRSRARSADSQGRTLLHLMAEQGKLEIAKILIQLDRESARLRDSRGNTPLHLAAEQGHMHVLTHFVQVDRGCTRRRDSQGRTLLHLMAQQGKLDVVKHLVQLDAISARIGDFSSRTPLHLAVEQSRMEVVSHFIELDQGFSRLQDSRGWTPLHLVAEQGNIEVVKHLTRLDESSSRLRDLQDRTPLHLAAGKCHMEVITHFIDLDKGCAALQDGLGQTPLHLVTEQGKLEVVKHLIELDANSARLGDSLGRTPLHLAAAKGHIEVVKHLVQFDKGLASLQDFSGRTPLHLAAEQGNMDVITHFIHLDRAIAALGDGLGRTPLHLVTEQGKLEVIKHLIHLDESCARLRDSRRRTPLHWAAEQGHIEVVKHFIQLDKALASLKDGLDRIPLHLAAERGHLEIVKYLVQLDENSAIQKDSNGQTVFDRAVAANREDIIALLQGK